MFSYFLNKIDTNNLNFFNNLNNYLKKNLDLKKTENFVRNIIFNIKTFKDKALFYYINKFDKLNISNINNIKLDLNEIEKSFYKINYKIRHILEFSKNRIDFYHENQKNVFYKNWKFIEYDGTFWGQKINFIEKLGLYIPGGKALYPSSVFMNTSASRLLGIKETYISTPLSRKNKNYDLIVSSFYLSGVKNIFLMGGAHAISCFSCGTDLVTKVDKIFGPGNIYVSLAKKILYGDTGIDIIAGPSEVVVFIDNYFDNLNILVLDLFSQCEHDFLSQSIFICHDSYIFLKIECVLNNLLPYMVKKDIIIESLKKKSLLIKTFNLKESINIINYISPEHLIVYSKDYIDLFKYIKNSGSVFLGNYCSETFGDYSLGVNHVLPTSQNSKFSSSLGIYDYLKKINFSSLNYLGFKKLFNVTSNFSLKEGLFAHSENLLLRNFFFN